MFRSLFILTAFCLAMPFASAALPPQISNFLTTHCSDCHSDGAAEGGLDLADLSDGLDSQSVDAWVRIHDRVASGEMPPAEVESPSRKQVDGFTSATRDWIIGYEEDEIERLGRTRGRRLTNIQLERTLHDLLGIDIPLAKLMPEEPRTESFRNVASGQTMSHFQLATHLTVVDAALDEAFRRSLTEPDEWSREFPVEKIVRSNPRRRCREPELLNDQAVVWSGGPIFYGRLPVTTARQPGWYRIRFTASALNKPEDYGVWCTVRTGLCVSSAPSLAWTGAFEATSERQEWTFEGWLPKGHMFEIRPGDRTLKQARFAGGQVGAGEGAPQNVPGIATHSLVLERFHKGADDTTIREYLFGDLPATARGKRGLAVKSKAPRRDAAELMQRFAERAFRRPTDKSVLQPYLQMVDDSLQSGESIETALKAGYRALLCSPRFLHFHESTGLLDDFALASRLSYMIWNSMPDEELFQLAAKGRLSDQSVIRDQAARMLNDDRGRQFVRDFAREWLDLSEIDFTEPDRRLYPGFDSVVQESMLQETHLFLQKLIDDDLSVSNLIDSEFTFLNSRLARYYGIDRVQGDKFQEVALRPADNRGGLMTHGSVLKVTANGTNTSPVLRGIWVSERLLGVEIPPPPESVPAIEPDIRGAKTIRDMLQKHESDPSCASCHVKIDPVGFALENFDPSGRWRDNYTVLIKRRRGKGPAVETGAVLPDGRKFSSFAEFQKLILADSTGVADNVVRTLITYGTGANCGFSDREAVADIVEQSQSSGYGFRSILQNVVASEIFRKK